MDINKILADQIYDNELFVAESNQKDLNIDYESYLALLDNIRDEKNYEWQSDIRIPDAIMFHLAQLASDVGQYFSTRDFVEVKVNDRSEEAKAAAEATKELVNRTLNRKDLYHYQKFVRAKGISNLTGRVYLKFWWEQEFETQQTGTTIEVRELDVDVNGEPITDDFQEPALEEIEVPVIEEVAVVDRFNYDVWDQRNVFMSDEYVYSLQDKEWIIFRSETTLSQLEVAAEKNGYFDLDKIDEAPETTDTKQETYQKNQTKENQSKAEKNYDLLERYGKYWVIEDGEEVKPGIDETGQILEDATYEEVIIAIVKSKSSKTLIGFKRTDFLDAEGRPYKPCTKGMCYIHPATDEGMGDGQNLRELQTATDDTFNLSQDRTMFSMMPMLKGSKQSLENNSTLTMSPGGMMELIDVNDVQEIRTSSDIGAALNQLQYIEKKERSVTSMSETTTGGVPSMASTTATAVSDARQSSNSRGNFKSMTFEYTALLDMYWMISQMTYRFATDKTGFKLMGDKLIDFNPTLDFYYTPLSQSIEPEASKMAKRRDWTQLYQITAQVQHPDTPKRLNQIYGEIVKLMGDEFENVIPLDEKTPVQQGGQQGSVEGDPTSNQYGVAQSQEEVATRQYAQ